MISNINSLTSIDYEEFSAWHVDFKFYEELTQSVMSSNQIGGFFNRLEASRTYLFVSVGVLGTSGNSVIWGFVSPRTGSEASG
jgi:elongation factor 1-gamma